jgi:asparagine synthase (glutamine-hydrolysing)
MCGIAGFFGELGSVKAVDVVLGILRSQVHRGPDGAGIYARTPNMSQQIFSSSPHLLQRPSLGAATCVLGHNLLAIQDLSAAARQPMRIGPLTIAFNGEIYNFIELRAAMRDSPCFDTQSDTEVILRLWLEMGIKALDHFRGMFAFLIHDARDDSLTVVRDHFGIKPVYFVRSREGLYFASEMRAFHASGLIRREIRPGAALACCAGAAHRFSEFESLYESVSELPGGYWMRLERGKESIQRYYQLPPPTNESDLDDDCDIFGEALDRSVRMHLRSARRVASCLSGGLDSSTLIALIGRQIDKTREDFTAFTANSVDQAESEVHLAREVAGKAGVDHHVFDWHSEVSPVDALDMALAYEVPNHVIGPINQYQLLQRIAESGAAVVVDGQGGDELLSGYSWFFPTLLADMHRRGKPHLADSIMRERLNHQPFDPATTNSFDRIFYDSDAWLDGFMGSDFLGTPRDAVSKLPEFQFYFAHDGSWASFRERAYTRDTLYFLLRQEDRLGMRFGLEARVPYVDVEVVESAARLASSLLVRDGYLKYPLRRMKSGIPESVRWSTRKRGFWDTSDKRFPWMKELSLCFASQSRLLKSLFPKLEQDWEKTRSDQQWRILQIALLEVCEASSDIPAIIRDRASVRGNAS